MRGKGTWMIPVLIFLVTGCGYPTMRVRKNADLDGRDNLVRFLVNRAIAAHYQGDEKEVAESLALAQELYEEPPGTRVPYWKLDVKSGPRYPRFMLYTAYPAMPKHRRQHGRDARKILYPVWGFPFDLAELPLKGYACIPIVGVVTYTAPTVAGKYMMEHAFDDSDQDLDEQFKVFCFGMALTYTPEATLLILNGLPAMVYPSDWEGRMEDWKHCALWWAPNATNDVEFQGSLTSAFFPNARRISGRDPQIKELRDQIRAFCREPLEAQNRKLRRVHAALDGLPKDATREDVSVAVFMALYGSGD